MLNEEYIAKVNNIIKFMNNYKKRFITFKLANTNI